MQVGRHGRDHGEILHEACAEFATSHLANLVEELRPAWLEAYRRNRAGCVRLIPPHSPAVLDLRVNLRGAEPRKLAARSTRRARRDEHGCRRPVKDTDKGHLHRSVL